MAASHRKAQRMPSHLSSEPARVESQLLRGGRCYCLRVLVWLSGRNAARFTSDVLIIEGRLTREKHSILFNISFMRHGVFRDNYAMCMPIWGKDSCHGVRAKGTRPNGGQVQETCPGLLVQVAIGVSVTLKMSVFFFRCREVSPLWGIQNYFRKRLKKHYRTNSNWS